MNKFFLFFTGILLLFSCDSGVILNEPIKPNHRSQNELNADVLKYYNYFKKRYIKLSNGNTPGGGYYVLAESTGGVPEDWVKAGVGAKSNSEAIGYGMIISSLLGDKEVFDGLYNFYIQYPSDKNPVLMSWVIPETEDQTLSKTSSASDADMDISYGLYLAHKKWGSNGKVNYLEESIKVAKACDESLIGNTNVILMGDWSKDSENIDYRTATRSSDWFPGHFRLFEHLTGNSIWGEVNKKIYKDIIPKVANNETGLVPDFIKGDLTAPKRRFLEGPYDGFYNWNSCRYPWRQSIGYGHLDDEKLKIAIKKEMSKLAEFTIGEIGGYKNFYDIHPGYDLMGYPISGRDYWSSAFSSPLITTFTVDEKYQEYLNVGWDFLRKSMVSYFGDSITLLNMLYISGIWYDPVNGEPAEVDINEIPEIALDQSKLKNILIKENWVEGINKISNTDLTEAVISFSDEIVINAIHLGEVQYSIGVYNFPIKIEKGNYYQIDFKAKSPVERDIFPLLSMSSPPWNLYGGEYISIKGDNQWNDYRLVFEMTDRTDTKGQLGIQFGKMPKGFTSLEGTFYLKDITVKEYID